uniref:Uncharacterized protein n=1 Tax=Candidatus Kentrum sp. DK TaxID=2126562 RepID=A0A450T3D0_9GAMM|nr:MAG: hypothetical protein BECKDK2373B_GA0170837_10263 [Candidatus Kentron sp. DK]VFJ61043.1 MAG: hypothetical protein BECKDK2373C_GA0170839_108615 [Candidatus Kentron sp. DK]
MDSQRSRLPLGGFCSCQKARGNETNETKSLGLSLVPDSFYGNDAKTDHEDGKCDD